MVVSTYRMKILSQMSLELAEIELKSLTSDISDASSYSISSESSQ